MAHLGSDKDVVCERSCVASFNVVLGREGKKRTILTTSNKSTVYSLAGARSDEDSAYFDDQICPYHPDPSPSPPLSSSMTFSFTISEVSHCPSRQPVQA